MDSPVASLPLIAPQPGFICGTVPIPTAPESHSRELVIVPASSIKVVSDSSVSLRYNFLPAEMDLNDLPANWLKREELVLLDPHLLTDKEAPDKESDDLCSSCSNRSLARPLPKKCEDLVVNGLAVYGDEIDFIAPASVMKQIFKTPYSKAPISVAVHRIGKTLILNDGPDAAESKSKQSSQTMTLNKDLFYKFVHHSVASAVPPVPSNTDPANSPPSQENPCRAWQFYNGGRAQATEPYVETVDSPVCPNSPRSTGFRSECADDGEDDATWQHGEKPRRAKRRGFCSGKKRGKALGKRGVTSQSVGVTAEYDVSAEAAEEELTSSEAEDGGGIRGPKAGARERFLRVLFWKFRELQMLLGSDLLLFGNDQHKAVSLHLMEVERQMSPLTWLDAWLDSMMANVPELAVCYHKQGVVQGYELLKTDDLFLLKGVGSDGTVPFHPQVVHANAAAVLQFLRKNCTSEPGAYWLVKNAGEDLMQLFDLSTISDDDGAASEGSDDEAHPLPDPAATNPRGPESYKQALALLIYRLALQLARSKARSDQRRSGSLLMQCLELMEDKHVPDLVAAAHERMARLCLEQAIPAPLTAPPLLLEAASSQNLLPSIGSGANYLPGPESERTLERAQSAKSSRGDSRSGAGLKGSKERKDGPLISDFSAVKMGQEADQRQAEERRALVKSLEGVGATASSDEAGTVAGLALRESAPIVSADNASELDPDRGTRPGVDQISSVEAEGRATDDTVSVQDSASGSSEAEREEDINRHLSAVHHFSQAIRAIREELSMLNSKTPGKRRARKHVNGDGLATVTGGLGQNGSNGVPEERGCNCKGPRHEARVARTEAKMQKLMGCLAESYLELGRAYEGDGQLARALKAAELASVVGKCAQADEGLRESGSEEAPRCLENSSRAMSQPSSSLGNQVQREQENGATPKPKRSEGAIEVRLNKSGTVDAETTKLPQQKGAAASARRGSGSKADRTVSPDFWGNLWSFVGDLYAKLQRDWGEESLLAQQAALLSGAPRLEEAVAYEAERLHQGLGVSEGGRSAGTSGTDGMSGMKGMGPKSGRKTGRGARVATSDADLLCFGRPLTLDYDVNLTAAAESYSKAIAAMGSEAGTKEAEKLELAHRRLGWTCNELGRRRLEEGDISAAEGLFTQALRSFGAVKDTANAVLVHCNMGHARRGQAEAMVAEAAALEKTPAGERLKQVRAAHTVRCYRQALSHYIAARAELLSAGEAEAQRSLRGLWTEAHTQLGHTYLRFGMFLADVSRRGGAGAAADVSKDPPSELLTKALHLYESLGPTRAQEAAYSHCQLAGHFRDRCLAEVPADSGSGGRKRNEDARGKRFAALAERHWEKALEFYRADTHPDMYINVNIERSALALKCAAKGRPSNVMDAALSHLAVVLRVFQPDGRSPRTDDDTNDQSRQSPSKQTIADLKGHLEYVTRELLQAHVSFLKHKSCPDADAAVTAATEHVTKLKAVYRDLLRADSSQAVKRILESLLDGRPSRL